jgi:hypothetical protein
MYTIKISRRSSNNFTSLYVLRIVLSQKIINPFNIVLFVIINEKITKENIIDLTGRLGLTLHPTLTFDGSIVSGFKNFNMQNNIPIHIYTKKRKC